MIHSLFRYFSRFYRKTANPAGLPLKSNGQPGRSYVSGFFTESVSPHSVPPAGINLFVSFLAFLTAFAVVGCSQTAFVKAPTQKDWDRIAVDLQQKPTPKVDEAMVAASYDQLLREQKEDNRRDFNPDKVGEKLLKGYRSLTNDLPDISVAQLHFKNGLEQFEAKNYHKAIKEFKSCHWYCSSEDSILDEDSMFMIAECYFFNDEYSKAVKQYGKLVKMYENSRYCDRMAPRLFAIGRYWENLYDKHHYNTVAPNFFDKRRPLFDTNGNAIKAFAAVQMQNANGTLADDAVMASGNNYFRNQRYTEASEQYDMLCENYNSSPHLMRAYLLNLQCKLQMYEGPHYDAKPLEDAEKIAKHVLTFYGPELPSEKRKEILDMQNQFQNQRAERDMVVAQFYDGKKYYGSAREYYRYIQQDYPGTEMAQHAQVRGQEIASFPAQPTDHFSWLKYVFPED